MDSNELAKKMLEYGELSAKLSEIETEIKAAVLELGKTQTVGNVRATYSQPRKTYQDWESAVMEAEPEGLDTEKYTEVIPAQVVVNWQKAATDFGIERKAWIAEDAKPSVTVKII